MNESSAEHDTVLSNEYPWRIPARQRKLTKSYNSNPNSANVIMGLDPLSPIAPARIRALLLPFGRIKRTRFQSFVGRLQPENVVRLGDVSPDGRPNRSTHSPP